MKRPDPAYRSTTRSHRGAPRAAPPRGTGTSTPRRGGPARSRGQRRRTRPPESPSTPSERPHEPIRRRARDARRWAGSGTSTGSSGCAASTTSTDSTSGHSVSSTPDSMTPGCAMRQSSTGTISRERCRRSPARPDASTANSTRVRQRSRPRRPGPAARRRRLEPGDPRNCSRTTAALSARCARGRVLEVAPTAEAGAGIRARRRDPARSGLEHLDGVGRARTSRRRALR